MLQVQCKGCGREFEPTLQVDPAELKIDRPFNSMEVCPHCKTMHFYLRDDFHVSEGSSSSESQEG